MDNSKLEVRIRRSDDGCHDKTNQRTGNGTYNNIYWNIPPTKYKKGSMLKIGKEERNGSKVTVKAKKRYYATTDKHLNTGSDSLNDED